MLFILGIGNDPRENRKFNMIKQGLDYDKDGDFIRLWIPELSRLRGGRVHHPWSLPGGDLASVGVELGVTYPRPMVTAPEWSRHTGKEGAAKQRGVDFYFKPQNKPNNNNQNKTNHHNN